MMILISLLAFLASTKAAIPIIPECGENEVYISCGSRCQEGTCDTNVICTKQCDPPGCYCQKGFARQNGQCVRCPECGLNEIYSTCGSRCLEGTCNPFKSCPEICLLGCFCQRGYVRYNGNCILCPECPADMYYDFCGSGCGPASCDNLQPTGEIRLCPAVCVEDCFCQAGLVKDRDDGDRCIKQDECPDPCQNKCCTNGGTCVSSNGVPSCECEDEHCPDGQCELKNLVDCFVDPCDVTTCESYPEATCVADYCGGCNALFFVEGQRVDCEVEGHSYHR